MFSSPAIRLQSHENSNNVAAKKANITSSSTSKKAFNVWDLNRASSKSNSKQTVKTVNKLGDIKLPQFKKVEPKYPDWLMDTCSYKAVEDTFDDILPADWRLTKKDLSNLVKAQSYKLDHPKSPDLLKCEAPPLPNIELNSFVLDLPKAREPLVFDYVEVEEHGIPMANFDAYDF